MTEPHDASFKKKLNDTTPTEPITIVIVLNDIFALFTLSRLTTGINFAMYFVWLCGVV